MIGRAAALLLRTALTMVAAVLLVFLLVRVMPGDVVDLKAVEGGFDEGAHEALRAQLGLDQPWPTQFTRWTRSALEGDLGLSLRFERPVTDMILFAAPSTLQLAARSLTIGLGLGVGLAVLAVLRPRPFAAAVQVLNIWSIALPTFCVGLAAILVFSVWLHWLPVSRSMLVPSLVLGLDIAGQIAKPLHEELKETLSAPLIRTARARGLTPVRIVWRHLLPNALPVAIQLSGLILAGLIGGTLTMEALFALPGLGTLVMQSIAGRDYPVVQAVILVFAVVIVLVNALTDLVRSIIDPRLRTRI